jgi:hypothetical protein
MMFLQSKCGRKWFYACVLAALLHPITTQADVLYNLAWRGTMYTTRNGKVLSQPFTEKMFINQVARDYELNAKDLALVYRPEKRDISMVRRSNGAFVASIIQMEYVYTDVGNSNGSKVVRQTFLFDEYHDSAIGTAFGTERMTRNTNGGIVSFTFTGRFNYAYPDLDRVFAGSFSTGARIKDRSAKAD